MDKEKIGTLAVAFLEHMRDFLNQGIKELGAMTGTTSKSSQEDQNKYLAALDKIGVASSMLHKVAAGTFRSVALSYQDKFGTEESRKLITRLEKETEPFLHELEALQTEAVRVLGKDVPGIGKDPLGQVAVPADKGLN